MDVAGTYTLRWTETNDICEDWDEVEITFLKGTLADATTMFEAPDISTIIGTPVIIYTSAQYGNLAGTDPDINVNALVETSFAGGFPEGTTITHVRYRQTGQADFSDVPVVDGDIGKKNHS